MRTLNLLLTNRLCFITMSKKPNEKCLNEHQCCKDVEELLETMKIVETTMDDDGDVNIQKLNVGLENRVIF